MTLMHHYAARGWYNEVQLLINQGMDPDIKNSEGVTPIMLAAKFSHKEVVKLLIEAGANIYYRDADRKTLLHHASFAGFIDIVHFLINQGFALNKKDYYGMTPLMVAVKHLQIAVVEALVNSGADIHCRYRDGWTLLHHASRAGSMEIVKCLLNKGIALDKKNKAGKTSLMLAAEWSHREVLALLMESGADCYCCDNDGWTVMHYATFASVKIVQYLVSKKFALDKIVQCLNKKDKYGCTPLMAAVAHSPRAVIEVLIKSGSDFYCIDNNGLTLLHLAVQNHRQKIAKYLLAVGADCNLEDKVGESPFSYLMKEKKPNVETIKLFIEKGAYVKSTDYEKLLKHPLLITGILKNVKLCSQVIINKFNNKDLPLFYKGISSNKKLPHIDRMKIRNNSGMALGVEKSVANEIQSKGFCNLVQMVPVVLGVLAVKSFTEKPVRTFNEASPSESQNGLKRLGSCNNQKYPFKRVCK